MIAHRPLPAVARPGWPRRGYGNQGRRPATVSPLTGDYPFVRGVFPGEVAR